MIYFLVGVSVLLGSLSSVCANGLQINGPECGIPPQGMIVNGTVAGTNQFPWAVYLEMHLSDGRRGGCGGSILTRRHILTAGHCTHADDNGQPFKAIYAYYGNNDWTRGKALMVTRIVPHPMYRPGLLVNDIAILMVQEPFQYGSNARPICIPTAPMNIINTETIVAGWGYLSEGGIPSQHLRYTSVRVLPNEMCAAVYHGSYRSDVMYCAYQKGTDSCQGDSGGPAISRVVGGRYVQVGIVSFGIGCARPNIPGMYARVDVFTPWLKQVVGSSYQAYSSEVPLQLASDTTPLWPSIPQIF